MRFVHFLPMQIRTICLLLLLNLTIQSVHAQSASDSTAKPDTSQPARVQNLADTAGKLPVVIKKKVTRPKKDTTLVAANDSSTILVDTMAAKVSFAGRDTISLMKDRPYGWDSANRMGRALEESGSFEFLGRPERQYAEPHHAQSYDALFYMLVVILFYFAFIRLAFGKYLDNLFTLFFRVSMRHQQIREQVIQSPLPSLLLNILFVVVAGIYGAFLAQYFKVAESAGFWLLFVNFAAILCIVYLAKFLLLKSVGWIFNIQRATDTYIFIIFLTNKMLGVFLLPFLIMLSFSASFMTDIAVTLSLILIFSFLLYRFIASYNPVRKEIKLNGFHFFLYLCAFEILPLMLIYKALLTYLEKAY